MLAIPSIDAQEGGDRPGPADKDQESQGYHYG